MNDIFAQRFRMALGAADVSYAEIARACGVTRQAVKNWKQGVCYPSSSNLITICERTGAAMEWLMWPFPADIRSTPYAPNGAHVKDIIRSVLEEVRT